MPGTWRTRGRTRSGTRRSRRAAVLALLAAVVAGCADNGPDDGLSKVPPGTPVDQLGHLARRDLRLLFAARSPDGRGVEVGLSYWLGDGGLGGRRVVALCRDGVVAKIVDVPTWWTPVIGPDRRYVAADVTSASDRIADLWGRPSLPPGAVRNLGRAERPSNGLEVVYLILLPIALPGLPIFGPIVLFREWAAHGHRSHWLPTRVHVGDTAATVRDLYGPPTRRIADPTGTDLWLYDPPADNDGIQVASFVVGLTGGRVSLVLADDWAHRLKAE